MTPNQPSAYRYADPIGGPPQLVMVDDTDDELVAVFATIAGGDDQGEVPVVCMAGEFTEVQ